MKLRNKYSIQSFLMSGFRASCLVALASFGLALSGCASKSKVVQLCDDVRIESQQPIGFDGDEARLICGDPQVHAWSRIPVEQKKMHLKGILQDRAYFNPIMTEDKTGLKVDVGPMAHFATIELKSLEEGTGPDTLARMKKAEQKLNARYRGVVLDPKRLTAVEIEVRDFLKSEGHPCMDLQSLADADSGRVVITVKPGPESTFGPILKAPSSPPFIDNFARYAAFEPGQLFDGRLLQITETRIMQRGVAQHIVYTSACSADKGYTGIGQTYYLGPPRLFRIGVGANTQDIVNFRTSIRHGRLTEWGSSAEAELYASYFEQQLRLQGNWFYTPPPDQKFLSLRLTGTHENRRENLETASLTARLEPTIFGDAWGAYYQHAAGPAYNVNFQLTSPRGTVRHLSFFYDALIESHAHEFHAGDPVEGYRINFTSSLAVNSLLSPFSALRTELDTEHLWLFELGRLRQMVMGLRTELFETFRSAQGGTIPDDYRHYLGGSANIRGFGRNELPIGYNGALSSLYVGVESRLKNFYGPIEPLLFLDFAAIGRRHLQFSPPYYMSPGVGGRWKTPFGTIRSTLAMGFVSNGGNILSWRKRPTKSSWPFQFYFSWGEEF